MQNSDKKPPAPKKKSTQRLLEQNQIFKCIKTNENRPTSAMKPKTIRPSSARVESPGK